MTRILFVEDDANLGLLLKENLDHKGYNTVWCSNGSAGYDVFCKEKFNLCILDVMLPKKDGFTLSKEIRAIDNNIPIIFLTARGQDSDKIAGFESGGDDYVTKPFSTQELCLRINAILKRTQAGMAAKNNTIGKFAFDQTKMTLKIGNDVTKLSAKETELLAVLAENKNELVPRNFILEKVWGNDDYFSAKSMDVFISKIRKLLRQDPTIEILNAYGKGFKLIVSE